MLSVTWTLICIIASLLVYFYMAMMRKFQYWAKLGVPHRKPVPFLGNMTLNLFRSFDLFETQNELHKHFLNEKYFGMYSFTKPVLAIRDPGLLERILVKDFRHFEDRENLIEDRSSIANLGLFNIKGNEWRAMRHKISPTFSSGKLKSMSQQMLPNAKRLIVDLETGGSDCRLIKSHIGSFIVDVMANVVFGIDLSNEELHKEYMRHSELVFAPNLTKIIGIMVAFMYPRLAVFLGFKIMDPSSEDFFTSLITETFSQRIKSGYERNDYVQLLIKLKEQKYLEFKVDEPEDEDLKTESNNVESFELTEKLLVAQAFQFLSAGSEPLHNAIMLMLFEIALNDEIQNKVRAEIMKSLKKNGGYNYQAIKDMTYLEQCFHETLRKYPVIPFLARKCTKEYKIDEHYTVEKGTSVMVSVKGIHDDPIHFPDPEKFDPDRFLSNVHMKNLTFLAFGAGPRFCIGKRFAIIEVKLAVATIFENFQLNVNPKTKIPLEKGKKGFINNRTDFIYFDIMKIEGFKPE